MAFGMTISSGDYNEIIKYDARAGRLFRVDRDVSGEKIQVDITSPTTKFAIDFGTLQVGYVAFSANGPVRDMVPYGQPLPAQPQTKDDNGKLISRPGFMAMVYGTTVGGPREWCSNAAILLSALDELYQVYEQRPEAQQGKIPVVCIASTVPVTSGKGAQKSTNYRPVFEIVMWTDRTPEMGTRTVPVPARRDTLSEDSAALQRMTAGPAPAAVAAQAAGMPF